MSDESPIPWFMVTWWKDGEVTESLAMTQGHVGRVADEKRRAGYQVVIEAGGGRQSDVAL